MSHDQEKFDNFYYRYWRAKRISKLESILPIGWLSPGKVTLELGCGFGAVSWFLYEKYGITPNIADAREEYISEAQRRYGIIENKMMYHIFDQNTPWKIDQKFDLIIHWGVLYHLDKWHEDLLNTWNHLKGGGYLSLETQVVDNPENPEWEEKKLENDTGFNWDHALRNQYATRFSASKLDRILSVDLKPRFYGYYPDGTLNVLFHRYDWKDGEYMASHDGQTFKKDGIRRFYLVQKKF